jgi:hypothetical protein
MASLVALRFGVSAVAVEQVAVGVGEAPDLADHEVAERTMELFREHEAAGARLGRLLEPEA